MENKDNGGTPGIIPPCPVNRWILNLDLCTVCGECVDACNRELLKIENDMIIMIDEGPCSECGDCAAACGQHAIWFK